MDRFINLTGKPVKVHGQDVAPCTEQNGGVLRALGGYQSLFAALNGASRKSPLPITAVVGNRDFGDHAKATEVALTPLWTALFGIGNSLPGRPNVEHLVDLTVLTPAEIEAASRDNVVPIRRPDDAAAA